MIGFKAQECQESKMTTYWCDIDIFCKGKLVSPKPIQHGL